MWLLANYGKHDGLLPRMLFEERLLGLDRGVGFNPCAEHFTIDIVNDLVSIHLILSLPGDSLKMRRIIPCRPPVSQ
jgi:hypothetical protein